MSKGTTRRAVRIEDALWLPALAIAKQRGENLSDIIRKALQAYIDKHEGDQMNPRNQSGNPSGLPAYK